MITKERVLEILDKSKPEDKVSFYAEIALSSLIIMNLIAVSLESVPSLSKKYSSSFYPNICARRLGFPAAVWPRINMNKA